MATDLLWPSRRGRPRPGATALAAHRAALTSKDPLALGAALRALGAAGAREDLERIGRLRTLRGWLAREASFATTLLAHRFGVPGHAVSPQRADPLVPDRRRSRELTLRRADTDERAALARSVAAEPLAVTLALEHLYRLVCGPRELLVGTNRELMDAADDLPRWLGQPAVAALVLQHHRHDGAMVPIYYLLTDPSRAAAGPTRLTLLGSGGRLCGTGTATIEAGTAKFSVKAVDRPGNVAARVDGTFERGRIAFEIARVGLAVSRARSTDPGPG